MQSELKKYLSFHEIQALGGLVVLFLTLSSPQLNTYMLIVSGIFLATAISSSVHNAEVIAHRIGPSLGTLVLALSVTVIEVAMIINLMKTNPQAAPSIARDTVFAAVMIVTNGIVGISLLLGGLRYKELGFQTVGTSSLMAALATLSCLTMVLPNYTTTTQGPTYSEAQLVYISIAALFIYLSLVWAQTKSYKSYFESFAESDDEALVRKDYAPTKVKALVSFVGLIASLIVVVGLAKVLSPTLGLLVTSAGAPASAVGIIVALLVLAPETFAALNAAKENQLQTSLNLALGSGAASIALTIPVVSFYSIVMSQPLLLGLDAKSVTFLILTFIAAGYTFGSGRTTALHGVVHLVILASYLALSFIP